jgi:cytochrome b
MPDAPTQDATDSSATRPVRVWDFPTRAFHWALVLLVLTSYVTAELDELDWHMRSGECILALLLFRLIWGLVGSDTARFAAFIRGPRTVWRYCTAPTTTPTIGHNPAGGWSVVAILLVLCAQVATGLFSDDDISTQGPFGQFVTRSTRKFLTGLHHRNFNILLALVALHIAAIAYYRFRRRQDLISPMLRGTKSLPAGVQAPRIRGLLLAAIAFAAAAAAALWVASFGDSDPT